MRDVEKTIGNIIDKQSVAFIGSVDADGFPNMKAMLPPRKRVGIKEFYFTTNTSSMRVAQYIKEPKACIYFFDKRFFQGVQLIGKVEVTQDNSLRAEIWKQGDELFYPDGGVISEDYCILKFTAQKGRYYHHFKSEDFEC